MLGTAAALGGWLPLCKWRRRAMNSRGGLLYVHDGGMMLFHTDRLLTEA